MLRVLLVLSRLPEDPGSRFSWNTLRIAECLSLADIDVRLLATTATERPLRLGADRFLSQLGLDPQFLPGKSGGRVRPEIHYRHGRVDCRVVDVGNGRPHDWESTAGRAFDAALDRELQEFAPDVVVMEQSKRQARVRATGAKVVLQVADEGATIEECDGALCHSEWLASQYDAPVVALPPPVTAADVIPESREPLCIAFLHPAYDSGLCLLLRLAEQLCLHLPDEPIVVLASNKAETTGRSFVEMARGAGFDLGQYENIMVAAQPSTPAETWASPRILVAPLLANPPAVLLAEALANGIPIVTGDRVDISDIRGDSGFVLPMPLDYNTSTRAPLPVSAVEPWVELIATLTTNEALYARESDKAREAARRFAPASLAARYAEFFMSLVK